METQPKKKLFCIGPNKFDPMYRIVLVGKIYIGKSCNYISN